MTAPMRSTCRSCRAPILWARTTADKALPLDPEPRADGNVALDGDLATVHAPGQQDLLDAGDRYVSHFVTCPQADEHRRPRATRVGEWGGE